MSLVRFVGILYAKKKKHETISKFCKVNLRVMYLC